MGLIRKEYAHQQTSMGPFFPGRRCILGLLCRLAAEETAIGNHHQGNHGHTFVNMMGRHDLGWGNGMGGVGKVERRDGSSGLNVDGNVDTIGHGPTNTKTPPASPTQQCQLRLQQKAIFHGSIKCTIRLSYIKILLARVVQILSGQKKVTKI